MSPARFDRPSMTDAVVLVGTGLMLLAAKVLLRWAKAGDDALADLGDEPMWAPPHHVRLPGEGAGS